VSGRISEGALEHSPVIFDCFIADSGQGHKNICVSIIRECNNMSEVNSSSKGLAPFFY
jgi:hypothetical protein